MARTSLRTTPLRPAPVCCRRRSRSRSASIAPTIATLDPLGRGVRVRRGHRRQERREARAAAELRDQIAKLGGIDITRAKGYVGLTFVIFVFAIGLFVCGQLAAVRDEETAHRLETLFALPYGRVRWLQGRIVCHRARDHRIRDRGRCGRRARCGRHGRAHDLRAGARSRRERAPDRVVVHRRRRSLLRVTRPASASGLLYAFVVVAFVWELFGALLSFPNWLLGFSPFHHLAPVPAKPIAALSALVMIAIGAAATGRGHAPVSRPRPRRRLTRTGPLDPVEPRRVQGFTPRR